MDRNWRDLDGPNFRYHPNVLAEREAEFLRQCGVVVATVRHVPDGERLSLVIEWISTEALKISEIEEDILARDSVRSSLRRQFGLQGGGPRAAPAEPGIAEKALAQGAGQPSLTALSLVIHRHRKNYYVQLEAANMTLDVKPWLDRFADLALAAQAHTLEGLDVLLANMRLRDRLRGRLNQRKEKALSQLIRAGLDKFVGGLSARKYMALTGAPAATARRDLGHLVELGALRRTGNSRERGIDYRIAQTDPANPRDEISHRTIHRTNRELTRS